MRFSNVWLSWLALGVLSVSTAQAQINGLNEKLRVFNDFSTTTLVTSNGNSVNQGPGVSQVTVLETAWADDGLPGTFANRHDYTLSRDSGATDHVFSIDDSYTVQTLVTLADGSNSPRKEAGFIIDSPVTGQMQYIVNSNGGDSGGGEIVTFGGPFYCFHCDGFPPPGPNPDYVTGTTILMGYTMLSNGAAPNTTEFFIDRLPGVPGGEESSGPLVWTNLEGGPVSYKISLYTQATPDLGNPAEFVSTDFNDIRFVPEPASFALGLIGFVGILGLRRRRK